MADDGRTCVVARVYALGDFSGDPTMHVTESIVVARARYEVYAFWRDFENLPRFMYHLESVTNIGGARTHWVAKSIAGRTVEWDAELVEDRVNERLSWRTVGATDEVRHAGAVTFLPHGPQATEVEVDLTYDAPGGKVGATIARLFGQEPGQQIQADLQRFKRIVETADTERPRVLVDGADMPARQKPVEPFGSERNRDRGF